jgi:uncharacterized glyoxalase superfamily protein PhnB
MSSHEFTKVTVQQSRVICETAVMPETIPNGSPIVPSMMYRNAPDAIEWLCHVFGFEKRIVVPGPDNTVLHAELTLGAGMLMLGSVQNNKNTQLIRQPDEVGGVETRSIYVVVPDADAVYARAKASGAEIVLDIEDKPHGGRGFACRDLEGRAWYVGSYDPWKT